MVRNPFSNHIFQPTLSPILKNRGVCLAVTGASIAQMGLYLLDKPGWICPIRNFLGCPCPGCGLTRAIVALFSGDISGMLSYHALTPFFILGLGIVTMAGVLPQQSRTRFIQLIQSFEQRTDGIRIFLAFLVLYWLIRLVFLNQSYIDRILN